MERVTRRAGWAVGLGGLVSWVVTELMASVLCVQESDGSEDV